MSNPTLTNLMSQWDNRLPTKNELLDYFKSLTPQQRHQIDALIVNDPRPWLSNPGPQTKAARTLADHLYYGGAAGGGKTDLLLGLSATQQWNSIIFRREFPQLRAIIQRAKALFEPRYGRYNSNDKALYYKSGRMLELGAMQHFDDREKYQGRPHDAKMFDEITHFLEMQFRYVIGWLRTTRPHTRTRVVAAGNPPINVDGRWVIQYWAPWIDEKHPRPAEPGELRYFIVDDNGRDIEVDGPGDHKHDNDTYPAHSRTFLPSSLRDNPYINAAYRATLSSLPEPLRSQLLFGDFKAGIEDDPYQLIPTDWVVQAQQRWREKYKGKPPAHIPLQQMGVDVSRGGKDRTILSPRHGSYFGEQVIVPGVKIKDGGAVASLVLKNCSNTKAIIGIDAIGVGTSPLDIMRGAGFKVLPIIGSAGSEATDKSGMLGFINQRAEIYWKFREALDPMDGEELALPDDPELLSELCAMTFTVRSNGIQVDPKEDVAKVLGRSPDKGDSIVYAHAHPQIPGQGMYDWFAQEYEAALRAAEEAKKRGSQRRY